MDGLKNRWMDEQTDRMTDGYLKIGRLNDRQMTRQTFRQIDNEKWINGQID
jgi:hypothetical protein